jgi:mono/diheme cytochrome c family protein
MRTNSFVVAAGAVAALALAGCGGGSSTATGDKPEDGKTIFVDSGCGGCHTLEAAGTTGGSGPNLSTIKLQKNAVALQVKNGGKAMPAFSGRLSDEQIETVAEYVAENDGS